MNHKYVIKSMRVQVPGMTKRQGHSVITFMKAHPCACLECHALYGIMRHPPLTDFYVGFASASVILQAMRLERCDFGLDIACRICQSVGDAIATCDEFSYVLHNLEQSHAFTREQIRCARIQFWFKRYWMNLGIEPGILPGDRLSRLVEEARLLIVSNEFPILDEAGFVFDRVLAARIEMLADWIATQVK